MDVPRTESSSSHFFHPPKSSAPIEIPGRPQLDPEPSAPTRSMSPELIFEMEPFSPLDLPPTHYSFGLSASCKTDDREPLLYPFPVLSKRKFNADRHTHPAPQSSARSQSPLPPMAHPAKPNQRCQSLQLRQNPTPLDPTHAIRAVPIHKITGFKPEFGVQSSESHPSINTAPREKRLAPPPRTSSFSSSPWLLPGRGAASDDEPRSLEVDPIDFTQYLLRRIDSQKPLQFRTFQAMMSVSVR
ncbi:hypothetical protein DFH09DRAFT_1365264 [Mycena vulgaris]|nr:hypothetical protein DFH09DRAFT_1365264 [Mycena vulgaris]